MAEGKINIKEIAAREGVSYLTALRWVQDGKILGVFKGGRWDVQESEYERFSKEGNRIVEKEVPTDEGTICNEGIPV